MGVANQIIQQDKSVFSTDRSKDLLQLFACASVV